MAAAAGCSIRMFQTHMLNQTASSLKSGKGEQQTLNGHFLAACSSVVWLTSGTE